MRRALSPWETYTPTASSPYSPQSLEDLVARAHRRLGKSDRNTETALEEQIHTEVAVARSAPDARMYKPVEEASFSGLALGALVSPEQVCQ